MTTQLDGAIRLLTTDEITAAVDEYAMIVEAIRVSRRRLGELEADIRRSMIANDIRRFPHPTHDVVIQEGRKVYDPDMVRAILGERVPDEIDKIAPTEPVECKDCEGRGVVAPKVNGTKARKYADLLKPAIITQADPELVIEKKEGKS